MTPQPPPVPMPSPLSAATLGKVRRMLVARLTPEVLNPFDRTPEREQLVRTTIAAILEDPELELAPVPALVAAVEAAVCGLGPLQSLVEDPEVSDILVNAPGRGLRRASRPARTRRRAPGLGRRAHRDRRADRRPGRAGAVGRAPDRRRPDGRRLAGQRRPAAGRRAVPGDPQVQPPAPRPRARAAATAATG